MGQDWQWLHEPPRWEGGPDELVAHAAAGTDFWRTTHYGFVRHNGHVFGRTVAGDFRLTAIVEGDYAAQYDQAGLMLMADEQTWLKAGIEYVDGEHTVSSVVTREVSDWSKLTLDSPPDRLAMRLSRTGDSVHVEWSLNGQGWTELRLAWFPPGVPVLAGVMCAAPDGPGFRACFTGIDLAPLG